MYAHLLTTSLFISFTLSVLTLDHVGRAQTTAFHNNQLRDHPEIFVGAAAYTRAGPIDQQVINQQSRKPSKPIVKPLQSPSQFVKSEQKSPADNIDNNKSSNTVQSNQNQNQNTKPVAAESTVNTRVNNDDTCLVRVTINDDWLHYARFRLINAFKKFIALISTSIQKRKQQHHRLHKRDTKCLWNNNIPESSSWSFDVIAKKHKSERLESNNQQYHENSFGEQRSELF